MKTQLTIVERRQRPREGAFAEIENITYRVLRKYGIDGQGNEAARLPEKAA